MGRSQDFVGVNNRSINVMVRYSGCLVRKTDGFLETLMLSIQQTHPCDPDEREENPDAALAMKPPHALNGAATINLVIQTQTW